MVATKILSQRDATILGLCSHGHTDLVDQKFKPEWLDDQRVATPLVTACITLHRAGKPITVPAIISRAKLNNPGLFEEVITIFENGFGSADPQDAFDHSYEAFVVQRADQIADEVKRQARANPHGVKSWLANSATQMISLVDTGDNYDPRPSELAKRPMPALFAQSLITGMNDILRGGYYAGWFLVYAGITKHGKSTTLRSHILDLALQKHRCALILTEGDEGIAAAQLAASLTGIDFMTEISPNKFRATDMESPEQRKARYERGLEYLNDYVPIYPASYCNEAEIERLIRWGNYKALVIDHLKDEPDLTRKRYPNDQVGHFADYLAAAAHHHGLWIGSAGQISTGSTNENMRKDQKNLVILFGSPRVGHATDEFIFMKRHPWKTDPPAAYFRVMLDKFFGQLDTIHEDTPIDTKRRCLEIKRLMMQNSTFE